MINVLRQEAIGNNAGQRSLNAEIEKTELEQFAHEPFNNLHSGPKHVDNDHRSMTYIFNGSNNTSIHYQL